MRNRVVRLYESLRLGGLQIRCKPNDGQTHCGESPCFARHDEAAQSPSSDLPIRSTGGSPVICSAASFQQSSRPFYRITDQIVVFLRQFLIFDF